MDQSKHQQDRQKSSTAHGHQDQQQRAAMKSEQSAGNARKSGTHKKTAYNGQQNPQTDQSQKCTLKHQHNENCQSDRKQSSAAAGDGKYGDTPDRSSAAHSPRRGSIVHPGSAEISTDGPTTTDQIDSDALHRT